MPNWCENKISIDRLTPALETFLKEDGGFSFERMSKPNRPESDESGWETVSAQNEAWGTKWDLDENNAKEVADSLIENNAASFDTAWSPPIEAITALSNMFPDVNFSLTYHEPGVGFYGVADFIDGGCFDEYSDVESREEYVKFLMDELGYDENDAKEYIGFDEEE
jgi:hypothetical protein